MTKEQLVSLITSRLAAIGGPETDNDPKKKEALEATAAFLTDVDMPVSQALGLILVGVQFQDTEFLTLLGVERGPEAIAAKAQAAFEVSRRFALLDGFAPDSPEYRQCILQGSLVAVMSPCRVSVNLGEFLTKGHLDDEALGRFLAPDADDTPEAPELEATSTPSDEADAA